MLRQIYALLFLVSLLSLPYAGQAQLLCRDLFQKNSQSNEITSYYENLQRDATWFRTHQLFWNQYKVFSNFSKQIYDLESESSQTNRDYADALLELLQNPRKQLSAEQILKLNSDTKHRNLTKLVLQIAAITEWNARVVQRTFHYIRGQEVVPSSRVKTALANKARRFISDVYHFILPVSQRPETSERATSVKVNAKEVVSWASRGFYNGPIRYLIPVLPLPKKMSPVEKIFSQQLRDKNHKLTELEIEILRQANALEEYQINQNFTDKNRVWHALRRWGTRAFVAAFAAHMTIIANWSIHLTKPDAIRPIETFLSKSEFRLQSNQVRIYNESVPFPHMAIEVDGKVYSYGQTHMEVKTSQEYLMIEKIRALANDNVKLAAGVRKKEDDGSSVDLGKALSWTGLDRLPRSVQMVTLNLNLAQKDHLKRNLELATFSRYQNHTLAMDCATMVVKALSESTDAPVPFFRNLPIPIDASPSLMMMYFGLLKSMEIRNSDGSLLVGDIGQVAVDRANEARLHQLRNLYINAMESRIFLTFFALDVGIRGYVNLRYGADKFQALDPEVRRGLIDQKSKQVSELQDPKSGDLFANKYAVFIDAAKTLGATPLARRDPSWILQRTELREVVSYTFLEEVRKTRDVFQSPDTAFQDILFAGFKLDLLQKMKTQIETTLEMGEVPLANSSSEALFDQILKDARPSRR